MEAISSSYRMASASYSFPKRRKSSFDDTWSKSFIRFEDPIRNGDDEVENEDEVFDVKNDDDLDVKNDDDLDNDEAFDAKDDNDDLEEIFDFSASERNSSRSGSESVEPDEAEKAIARANLARQATEDDGLEEYKDALSRNTSNVSLCCDRDTLRGFCIPI